MNDVIKQLLVEEFKPKLSSCTYEEDRTLANFPPHSSRRFECGKVEVFVLKCGLGTGGAGMAVIALQGQPDGRVLERVIISREPAVDQTQYSGTCPCM